MSDGGDYYICKIAQKLNITNDNEIGIKNQIPKTESI